MKRFRMYYDKDAEEVWLNKMCQKGWVMTSFFAGLYTFAPCQPGEYIYQIDMPEGAGFQPNDIEDYTEFMEDAGVEVVQQWYRWVYLRKRAAEGPFQVYTDPGSQIALYRRIRRFFLFALVLELCCSAGVWTNLTWDSQLYGLYLLTACLFLLIFAVFFRVIWKCSRRIHALEAETQ